MLQFLKDTTEGAYYPPGYWHLLVSKCSLSVVVCCSPVCVNSCQTAKRLQRGSPPDNLVFREALPSDPHKKCASQVSLYIGVTL